MASGSRRLSLLAKVATSLALFLLWGAIVNLNISDIVRKKGFFEKICRIGSVV